jgi:hypothetical protein
MAWISCNPNGSSVPKDPPRKTPKLTEESFEDLCCFLGFSGEAESLHEIPRLVRHLVATLFQERRRLDPGLLCRHSELVEHTHRSRLVQEGGFRSRSGLLPNSTVGA